MRVDIHHKGGMKSRHLRVGLAMVLATVLFPAKGFAYQVWMGTHTLPGSAADNTASWSNTAQRVQGLNVLTAPNDSDPWTTADLRKVIAQFTNAATIFVECPRSAPAARDVTLVDELLFPALTNWIVGAFSKAATYNYTINNIMFYNNSVNDIGYGWSTIEVQQFRNILDGMGHSDVGLMYNARSFAVAEKNWCANPLVDHVVIEGSANDIYVNANNKVTLAEWLRTNPATTNKMIIFQMPRSESTLTQYAATRRAVQSLGTRPAPLGLDFVRSDKVVFVACNYDLSGSFKFAPETVPGNEALYTNSLTSLCLSLIEQRDLFEGRLANLPTLADADSYARNLPPTIGHIVDQTIDANTATEAIPFTIGDSETAATELTVTKNSSNPTLVPLANIVLGGTGANRSVIITPAIGQTGTSTITLTVSDGTLATTTAFELAVLASLDSDGDGMPDTSETAAGRNPDHAGDLAFEFNTDGSFDGWYASANITNQNVSGGSITGTATSGDPRLNREGFLFDSAAVPTIIIKLKASTAGQVQFFWGNTSAPGFAPSRRIDIPYTAANAWQAIVVPLAGHAEWDGKTIVNLRIDPISTSPTAFEIDWIRASDGDLDNDGIPDSGEDVDHIDVPNAYEQWAEANSVAGSKTDDDDGDGLLNLVEYALGGNPTNSADRGHVPTIETGTNWIDYVHARRNVASGVGYAVETADTLVAPNWTTNGVEVVGIGVLDATFDTVTNRVSTETNNEQFIRLIIQ